MNTSPKGAMDQGSISTDGVISTDGTRIGYRQVGRGPGLIVLHGSMSTGQHHLELAMLLAGSFTVVLPDRRGRGLSESNGSSFSTRKEVEDLAALIARTRADAVFGVSTGGIIALEAALSLPEIRRLAVYEPPLFRDPAYPASVLARFDRELAQGRVTSALVTGMLGAQMGPAFLARMPRWLVEVMTGLMLRSEGRKAQGGYVPMKTLAPTLHNDMQIVAESSGSLQKFGRVSSSTLLLGGSLSPAYMKEALDGLESLVANATRISLRGLDHAASWNSDRGGHPERVAEELRRFFA